MDLTIPQKKKHILLLNRLYREALKEELIPTPSKLSDDKIEKIFDRLFYFNDDQNYYYPKNKNLGLIIDRDEFKKLSKKPKKSKKELEEVKEPEMKQQDIFTNKIVLYNAIKKYYDLNISKFENKEVAKPSESLTIIELIEYMNKNFNEKDKNLFKKYYNDSIQQKINETQNNLRLKAENRKNLIEQLENLKRL